MERHGRDRSRPWQGQAGRRRGFVYICGRRKGWRPSKHGSQHVSMALAIDVRHGLSIKAPQGLAVFAQMGESAQPPLARVCVCVHAHASAPHPGLTFEHGADPPDPQAALTCKLAEGQLHEEERDPAEYQHDEVGKHEGSWQAGEGWLRGRRGSLPLPA